MKSLKRLLLPSIATAAFLAAGAVSRADTLNLVLDAPYQLTTGSNTVTFDVTIYNTGAADTIYLDGDSFNIDSPLTLDDSGFFDNAPTSLGPSDSSSDFELFTVTVPDGTPTGLYTGSFEILGGGPSDDNVIGVADFDVQVTPEPTSLLLLLTGLAGLAVMRLRGRFTGNLCSKER
jgi:hypothetical protein